MRQEPKTKFDVWLQGQYEVEKPKKVESKEPPVEKRLCRRNFDQVLRNSDLIYEASKSNFQVIKSCNYEELKEIEPKKIEMRGNFPETIANDQSITEHQATLQHFQSERNNIWTYGVHRNEVPVYETPNPPSCKPHVLGQAPLSTWHKLKR